MSKYRVLALDGGGIRGIVTTILLQRLCKEPGLEHVFDGVDLIAGNSSGALIALALAHGLFQPTAADTLARIREVFERGAEVFGPPNPFGFWLWPRYGVEARERGLQMLLGERTKLRDLQRHVLIPTFDLDNQGRSDEGEPKPRRWKPKIFHNFGPGNSDCERLAWEVGLFSSSAPAYFPTAGGYVDGGIYANNPSMCALAQIFDKRYAPDPKPGLDEVRLLSIGAGQNLKFIEGDRKWGVLRWAPQYVDLTMDGTVGVADYQCLQMLTDQHYFRLAPDFLPENYIALDDFDRIPELIVLADNYPPAKLAPCIEWLREQWMPEMPRAAFRSRGSNMLEKTSKHLGTSTELTVLMNIKPGFVPMLDTRTYANRLRIVFKVLQALRSASREKKVLKPIVDIVEAARTVEAFSWGIVNERQLLLTVHFDRPWESYIRVIWKDFGALMDLFLCNCEDFVPSADGFEAFSQFVRDHQQDTGFYYAASSRTVDDQRYLTEFEKQQREGAPAFGQRAAVLAAPGPETLAEDARHEDEREAALQWLAVLKTMYDLRNVYPQDSDDHIFLHRAVRALLKRVPPLVAGLPAERKKHPEIAWYDNVRLSGNDPDRIEDRKIVGAVVQGGILYPYRQVTHGCLLLATVEDAKQARQFIADFVGEVTKDSEVPRKGDVGAVTYRNIAFTFSGLQKLEVTGSTLSRLPKEFREGMEARAGLLGDVQWNHPDNWTLPESNVRYKGKKVEFVGRLVGQNDKQAPPARISSIDIAIVLHRTNGQDEERERHAWTRNHPLRQEVTDICERAWRRGIRVVSLEPLHRMRRQRDPDQNKTFSRDHFNFLDGISQPQPVDGVPQGRDEVHAGEILRGFQNQRGDPPFPEHDGDLTALGRESIADSGSFLVIRKLRQYVEALDLATQGVRDPSELRAKMVGRLDNGLPLLADDVALPRLDKLNAFEFTGDADGSACPFHSHIRRGNPRLKDKGGAPIRIPRIARRGLSYGPRFDSDPSDSVDRGTMFMAYNASIAEQFEIIQRWMSSGNTPAQDGGVGVFSGQPDPLLGLPDADGRRMYRYIGRDGQTHYVDLGPTPFVTLQWGLYLFAPSIPALELIAKSNGVDLAKAQDIVAAGEQIIQKLRTSDDWAAVLEDQLAAPFRSAVYAAIRAKYKGVRRTPYGVVVASADLTLQVLRNDEAFSVAEYQNRFRASVGKNYLGMDSGREYQQASTRPNDALTVVSEIDAFRAAREITTRLLEETIKAKVSADPPLVTIRLNPSPGQPQEAEVEVPLEPVIDRLLAELAHEWFDIPDGRLIHIGRLPEDVTPQCPFHFMAPSRYIFSSPNPRKEVSDAGQQHGQLLLKEVTTFVKERRERARAGRGTGLKGAISRKLFDEIETDEELARLLLGLVFGFVPTVYGNAIAVLGTWINDESLWRVQRRWHAAASDTERYEFLADALGRAMQTRPVPPLLHRMVKVPCTLGELELEIGERVVLGISGATEDNLFRNTPDLMMVFGGDRSKPDHPTHACPGAHLAKGVLLGLLSAILEIGTLTPKLSLVTVGVAVRLPPEGRSAKQPHESEMAAAPSQDTAAAAASCQDIPIEANPVLARSST